MGIANEIAANWKMLALVVVAVTAFQWTVMLFKMLDSMKDVLQDIRRDAATHHSNIESSLTKIYQHMIVSQTQSLKYDKETLLKHFGTRSED